jgi:ribosome-associated translation inhibitor RaiA
MPLISQVVARNLDLPARVREKIEERILKLDGFFDVIRKCVVTVEGPGAHHQKGEHSVRIAIDVPHREIAVDHRSDESLEIAVREAFSAADRQLQDYSRRLRERSA